MASSAEPVEIGRVIWGDMVAILRDDGTWTVPDLGRPSLLAEGLDRKYADTWTRQGPADGQPGAMILRDWAAQVEGEVTLADRPRAPAGMVY